MKWLYYKLKHIRLQYLNTSTSIPGLNRNEVYSLKCALPPYEEQRKVAKVLMNVEVVIIKHTENKTYFKSLKKALMQNLLTGKIRVRV